MSNCQMIEPRAQTPAPGLRDVSGTSGLPEAVVCEHVRRLAVFAAIGAALWTYGLVMDALVRPLALTRAMSRVNVVVEVSAIAVSAAMFLYVHFSRHSSKTKTDVGLVYVVLNAAAVAILNAAAPTGVSTSSVQLSWNTVTILVSAMILPCSPRKILIGSLVAATTDPLAVWLASLFGTPVPPAAQTIILFMPNYACAVVAMVPSTVLHRLGGKLRRAQEMGSYHLIELLGRGGMGEVWRAHHRLLARGAAVKLVRPELLGAGDGAEAVDMLRRFEQEAQATASLSSPHTIRVFDFGVTTDSTFYYVMELLEGRDLESLVREFGPLPAERALFLLTQVCHSLAEAHARGLIHRDVTPSNIYVCRMGLEYDFVKVLDFGLVRYSDRSIEQTLLNGRTTTGTPAFMAPEVILDRDVDSRADVYAVGCVAYFLLTGQHVFDADTPMKMFVQHLHAKPIPPSHRTELPVPADLEAAIMACLEKDPARRPQDADELLELLHRCRTRGAWDLAAAKAWWQRHLVEFTGPVAPAQHAAAPRRVAAALS
jgi:serine/threonine-protein kinase